MIILDSKKQNEVSLKKQKKSPVKKEPTPVDENIVATKELASAIKELATNKPDSLPNISPVFDALVKLQETQQALLESLSKREDPQNISNWEFAVSRDKKGAIEKIYAKGE